MKRKNALLSLMSLLSLNDWHRILKENMTKRDFALRFISLLKENQNKFLREKRNLIQQNN